MELLNERTFLIKFNDNYLKNIDSILIEKDRETKFRYKGK